MQVANGTDAQHLRFVFGLQLNNTLSPCRTSMSYEYLLINNSVQLPSVRLQVGGCNMHGNRLALVLAIAFHPLTLLWLQ